MNSQSNLTAQECRATKDRRLGHRLSRIVLVTALIGQVLWGSQAEAQGSAGQKLPRTLAVGTSAGTKVTVLLGGSAGTGTAIDVDGQLHYFSFQFEFDGSNNSNLQAITFTLPEGVKLVQSESHEVYFATDSGLPRQVSAQIVPQQGSYTESTSGSSTGGVAIPNNNILPFSASGNIGTSHNSSLNIMVPSIFTERIGESILPAIRFWMEDGQTVTGVYNNETGNGGPTVGATIIQQLALFAQACATYIQLRNEFPEAFHPANVSRPGVLERQIKAVLTQMALNGQIEIGQNGMIRTPLLTYPKGPKPQISLPPTRR